MEVDGKNWDQLLPHVLFAIQEVPQASTGFSPFELLYGLTQRANPRDPRLAAEGGGTVYALILACIQLAASL